MLRVTIWMNMPSPYQGDLFRALVDTGEVDLQVIFAHGLSTERKQIGWSDDTTGFTSCTLGRRWGTLEALRLARRQSDRIHIVNGLWAEPAFAATLCLFVLQGTMYIIYSEAPDPRGQRSIVKRLLQGLAGRMFARGACGWLPISRFATHFYESLGASQDSMYPFGYFRARPALPIMLDCAPRSRTELSAIFVGQLIERKGIDLLLTALGAEVLPITLAIVGGGPLRAAHERQTHQLGLRDRVSFEGVLPAAAIRERIARADVLILPSRWDGWGLVVNEALSVGVPVIVSDRCGAADVIADGVNGYVFRSGSAIDLLRCLRLVAESADALPDMRVAAAAVGEALAAEEVAPYLIACCQHLAGAGKGHPTPPWVVALAGEYERASV